MIPRNTVIQEGVLLLDMRMDSFYCSTLKKKPEERRTVEIWGDKKKLQEINQIRDGEGKKLCHRKDCSISLPLEKTKQKAMRGSRRDI